MCMREALEAISTSTVTCISLDRWHLNGNGKGGVETAVRGREEQGSDQSLAEVLEGSFCECLIGSMAGGDVHMTRPS
jgi:hypothetical protein